MTVALPERRWPLSAPESLVLLWGPDTGDTWALSLAILEIAVRHDLGLRTVTRRSMLFFRTNTLVLTGPLTLSQIAGTPLRALFPAHPLQLRYDGGVTGVPLESIAMPLVAPEVVRTARKRTRIRSGPVYVPKHVIPALVQRGLYTYDLPTLPPVMTDDGKVALAELRHLLAIGRETLPSLVEHDPTTAWRYLDRAGSALLLVRGLPLVVKRLVDVPDHTVSCRDSLDVDDGGIRPIPAGALLRPIGPGPDDDLDMALHAITTEVEHQWADSHHWLNVGVGTGE